MVHNYYMGTRKFQLLQVLSCLGPVRRILETMGVVIPFLIACGKIYASCASRRSGQIHRDYGITSEPLVDAEGLLGLCSLRNQRYDRLWNYLCRYIQCK